MLKIALCDDELEQLKKTEALLLEYQSQNNTLSMKIECFLSAAALLEHLRTQSTFDLYLLDVIMPYENGIELGLKIRSIDPYGKIFYLTVSKDYAVDSYLTQAVQYLMKPVNKERLFNALDTVIKNWLREHQRFITVKTRQGLQRIALYNIVYGELTGHCVHYHLSDNSVIQSTSLRISFREAVSPLLECSHFVLCATSFVVNLSFVEMINTSGLSLTGGITLPLSRTLKTSVTNKWLDYHLKGEFSQC